MFTIVSYYTPEYAGEASRLLQSLARFGLSADNVLEVKDRGDWQKNTQYKAEFLRDLRAFMKGPIVWLDADAEVMAYPTAFDVLGGTADVAVHYRDNVELLSGTLWFDDTEAALDLLYKWVWYNGKHPDVWDQRTLDSAIGSIHGLRVHRLTAPYCLIFDSMADQGPPVILHHQASRRLKNV